MKKATVIIIAAIYVASIIIVGVFGLKALIYSEMVYVEDILFDETINGAPVVPATDGNGYTVVVKYEDNLNFALGFTPVPANATLRDDITVTMTYQSGDDDDPCATYDSGTVVFHKMGQITLLVESQDGGKVSREIRILAI